jgi:hypothetical protein
MGLVWEESMKGDDLWDLYGEESMKGDDLWDLYGRKV